MKYISATIFKTIAIACFFAAMAACNKDLGNYDYTDINTVKIEGIRDTTAAVGDVLKIVPDLKFSLGEDDSAFNFTWYIRQNGEWTVLQEGRNLAVEVAGVIGKPTAASPYSLAYEVLNTKTQVIYRKLFSLTVINPLTKGFAALCELDNGFDIDMIVQSVDGNFDLYKNILEMTGSELPRENVKPYDILAFDDPMAPDPYNREGVTYSVFILTDQYTTRIKALDYSWKSSYDIANSIEYNSYLDKKYLQNGEKIIAQKMKFAYTTTNSVRTLIYIKEDNGQGNWYICSAYPAWYFYSQPMNDVRPSGNARYEPAPFVSAGANGAMYFNADKKSFMYQVFPSAGGLGTSSLFYTEPFTNEPSGADYYFNDPNEGLLYMGERMGNVSTPDAGYAILKQADGSFKYIEYGLANSLLGVAANKKSPCYFPAGSSIGNAKFIARDPAVGSPFLFYTTNDNKVYRVDVSSFSADVREVTSTFIADGYNEITQFKFTLPNTRAIGGGIEQVLAVATYNNSLGKATGGKLEFFRMTDTTEGNMSLTTYPADAPEGEGIVMSWKGLGKIVGLTYKEK